MRYLSGGILKKYKNWWWIKGDRNVKVSACLVVVVVVAAAQDKEPALVLMENKKYMEGTTLLFPKLFLSCEVLSISCVREESRLLIIFTLFIPFE